LGGYNENAWTPTLSHQSKHASRDFKGFKNSFLVKFNTSPSVLGCSKIACSYDKGPIFYSNSQNYFEVSNYSNINCDSVLSENISYKRFQTSEIEVYLQE